MNKYLFNPWVTSVSSALVLLALFWLVNTGLAQGPASQRTVQTTVSEGIPYQGFLTDPSGNPVNGPQTLRFILYNADQGGTSLWDSGDLSVTTENGLFNTTLNVNQTDFDGQALWLNISINGETLSPRQTLSTTPYALSLRPGAEISRQTDGDALTVNNVATGFAIRSESSKGIGVFGQTDDNYAVYGFDGGTEQARGYGGYFYSENGVGAYGRSNAESTAQNLWAPGVYGRSTNGVGLWGRTGSTLTYMAAVRGENEGFGYGGYFSSENGVPLYIIRNTGTGNIFEAWTLDPIARVFRISTVGNIFANGTYNSPAADFAELLPAQPGLEAGDVLVIGLDGETTRSTQAYQPGLIGVYSTQPGFLGGHDEAESGKTDTVNKVPVAIVGIVPVKASAENGPIQPGDLLTSSSTPGHAMRCEGVELCFGNTIGKALESLTTETGTIKMLVVAQ